MSDGGSPLPRDHWYYTGQKGPMLPPVRLFGAEQHKNLTICLPSHAVVLLFLEGGSRGMSGTRQSMKVEL